MFDKEQPDFTRNAQACGTYFCARCGHALFAANKKFEAGCGFPSFWTHLDAGVELKPLDTYGRSRVQLLCKQCGLHLGHLFSNKHTPTGLRYCINGEAIRLQEKQESPTKQKALMPLANEHFEELKEFIRQHRSNEGNFETLSNKLEEEISTAKSDPQMSNYTASLEAIKEKQASEYRTAKETGGSAWPEFEKFVSEWEKTISTATS